MKNDVLKGIIVNNPKIGRINNPPKIDATVLNEQPVGIVMSESKDTTISELAKMGEVSRLARDGGVSEVARKGKITPILYGTELIDDPYFNDASKWANLSPPTINVVGGKLVYDQHEGTFFNIVPVFPANYAVVGKRYRVEITVDSISVESHDDDINKMRLYAFFGGQIFWRNNREGVGTFVKEYTALISDTLNIYRSTVYWEPLDAVIDSISIREIL